jgi:hypothetical protein
MYKNVLEFWRFLKLYCSMNWRKSAKDLKEKPPKNYYNNKNNSQDRPNGLLLLLLLLLLRTQTRKPISNGKLHKNREVKVTPHLKMPLPPKDHQNLIALRQQTSQFCGLDGGSQ